MAMGAVTEPNRIATLDIVRGVAVMGILAMNIVAFAMPFQAYFNPVAYGMEATADLVSWVFSFVFVDGKMRGLFSFLFGASLLLVIERAEATGESPAAVHFRACSGCSCSASSISTSSGTATSSPRYALIGMLAYLFRETSPRATAHLGDLRSSSSRLPVLGVSVRRFCFSAEAAASAPNADRRSHRAAGKARASISRLPAGSALAGRSGALPRRLWPASSSTGCPARRCSSPSSGCSSSAGRRSATCCSAWRR